MTAAADSPPGKPALRPPVDFQEEFVEVDGTRIRVGIRPGRGRPLLLFNGIGANLDLTRPLAAALPGIELIVFDLPGAGASPPPRWPRRLPGLCRLSASLLDALGYVRSLDVGGVSWGGVVAQQFARQYPGRTNRLILAATSAGAFALPARPGVLLRMVTPRRYLSRGYMTEVAPLLYGGLARTHPALIGRHADLMRPPSRRGYLYQLYAAAGWTSIHWLHRLRVPTLVLAGDDDPIMPQINTRLLAWLIPGARFHLIRGGGHLFLVMRAEASAAIIRNFLDERRGDGTDRDIPEHKK